MSKAEASKENQREDWNKEKSGEEVVCRICECWNETCEAQSRHLHIADAQQVHSIRIDPMRPHAIHRCRCLNEKSKKSTNITLLEIHAETPLPPHFFNLQSACIGYARENRLQPLPGFWEST